MLRALEKVVNSGRVRRRRTAADTELKIAVAWCAGERIVAKLEN